MEGTPTVAVLKAVDFVIFTNVRKHLDTSAKHELWGACAPKRVRRRIETVFSHADLESCDDSDNFYHPPPIFGNDRHVKFLAVALHSHLNDGPDCCHRFVERRFMTEKKKTPLKQLFVGGEKNVQTLKPLLR